MNKNLTKFNLDKLKEQILKQVRDFESLSEKGLGQARTKTDLTPVTVLDQNISCFVEDLLGQEGLAVISEENNQRSFDFPVAILDPIDGTKELVAGLPECCVSLAVMQSKSIDDPLNRAWLYNPYTGFELSSFHEYVPPRATRKSSLMGMVSQTEFSSGLFEKKANLTLIPKGSIANKLGLLAVGACDFVISLRPKSIWDIAGGTILTKNRGFGLYVDGREVHHFDQLSYEGSTLLWCRHEHKELILDQFQK